MSMVEAPDIYYQCQRCANCCKWPGEVVLTEQDTDNMSNFLGLTTFEFVQRHTRLRATRNGLSLLEKPNGECEFLSSIECTINDAKPEQCRGFPNKWNFPGWRQVCEAVPVAKPAISR